MALPNLPFRYLANTSFVNKWSPEMIWPVHGLCSHVADHLAPAFADSTAVRRPRHHWGRSTDSFASMKDPLSNLLAVYLARVAVSLDIRPCLGCYHLLSLGRLAFRF